MLNFIKAHRPAISVSAGILLVLVLLLLFFPGAPEIKGPQISRDTSLEKLGIVAQAWINTSIVKPDENVDYSIILYNLGDSELQGLCVSLNAPGFSDHGNGNKCFTKTPAQTSATISGRLTPIVWSGQYQVTASYEAKRQNLTLRSAVSVGSIQVSGWLGEAMWIRFGRRTALLTKDLTLPFVLAVLGYLFQKRQAERDIEHRNAQAKREQQQEVRNIILPFVQALAEKHYMPIVRSAVGLIRDAGKWRSQTDSKQQEINLKLCFYDFVAILKRMAYLRRDKGQVFFQNRQGEVIVSDVWTICRLQCQNVFNEEGTNTLTAIRGSARASDPAQPESVNIDYASFAQSLDEAEIAEEFKKFSKWVTENDFARFLNLMNVLQAVFTYESNRPFNEHWYGDSTIDTLEFVKLPEPWPEDFPKPDRDFPSDAQYKQQLERLNKKLPSYVAAANSTQNRTN